MITDQKTHKMKKPLVILFLLFGAFHAVNAQVISAEMAKAKAQADVQKFKLNKADLKIFKENGKNPNSDFFKPTATYTINSSLLSDSTYVKEFRALAYKKTKRRKTAGYYILVGGVAFAVVTAIVTIPIAVTH